MTRSTLPNHKQSGASILEVLIASSLLAWMVLTTYQMLAQGHRLEKQASDLEAQIQLELSGYQYAEFGELSLCEITEPE